MPYSVSVRADMARWSAGIPDDIGAMWTGVDYSWDPLECLTYGIISLTLTVRADHGKEARSQVEIPQADQLTASSSRSGLRRPLPWKRLLRFQGSHPGEIRNASSGSGRPCLSRGCLHVVRCLATNVLRSAGRVRPRRFARAALQEAGASSGAQVDAGGHGLCQGVRRWRCFTSVSTTGRVGRETVRHRGASTQYRASPSPTGKRTDGDARSGVDPTSPPSTLATNYERLRAQILGEDTVGGTIGLATLLRHGMAEWISLCVHADDASAPVLVATQQPSSDAARDANDVELVNLLASMVIQQSQEVYA